jgi:hypothetical protein
MVTAGSQHQSSKRHRVVGRPFKPGQSGNPSGRRKGTVSVAACLKRLLSKPDAEKICRKLIEQAKAGDLQAVRLLLDRLDGPLSGPLAVAVAQAGVQTVQAVVDGAKVEVVIVDNGRGDSGLPGSRPMRTIPSIPATAESSPEAKPEPQSGPVDAIEQRSPVMTGADFLASD